MPPTYIDGLLLRGETTAKKNRRQSEWDDHGEAYPMAKDGPHVYCSNWIPDGTYVLSLYDVNKDGHTKANRFRDFRITVKSDERESKYDMSFFPKPPALARARITNFWGGVYRRLLVVGPSELTLEINRNYSLNTILAGVMLDAATESRRLTIKAISSGMITFKISGQTIPPPRAKTQR